jgi:glycosyltransferase involved in cell wall biosynthesis
MGALFSIVIPAYREEPRLGASLDALIEALDGSGAELIVVDDGSDDRTADIAARALAEFPDGSVLRLPRNLGKGAAVRSGVLAATGQAIVYMDADLASNLTGLEPLLAALDGADVAVGSRTVNGSSVTGSTSSRAVMARCFNGMARMVMRLPIRDTQCGFKAFRREAAERIFGLAVTNRFAFDVEVLRLAKLLDMTIVEVPVEWRAIEGSSVRLVDPPQMVFDLARIALRCRRSRLMSLDRAGEPHQFGVPALGSMVLSASEANAQRRDDFEPYGADTEGPSDAGFRPSSKYPMFDA